MPPSLLRLHGPSYLAVCIRNSRLCRTDNKSKRLGSYRNSCLANWLARPCEKLTEPMKTVVGPDRRLRPVSVSAFNLSALDASGESPRRVSVGNFGNRPRSFHPEETSGRSGSPVVAWRRSRAETSPDGHCRRSFLSPPAARVVPASSQPTGPSPPLAEPGSTGWSNSDDRRCPREPPPNRSTEQDLRASDERRNSGVLC